jgi:hypothetical protein
MKAMIIGFISSAARAVQFANTNHATVLVEITNELSIDGDGWAQIAPMGDFPGMALIDDGPGALKKVPAIQRIDKAAIANMVAEFQNSRKGAKKFLAGRPIYVGHPDVPGYESRYPDKSPKGVFADIAERNGAFMGMPVFTNEGSDLVENRKLRALSGRWSAEEVGEENGVKIFRPTVFISAGLTNKPNLPVQLLNEKGETNPNQKMKRKLLALFAALSLKPQFANAEEPTEAETEAAIDQAKSSVTTLANEKQQLTQKVTTLETEKTTLTTDLSTARTSFSNERNARIKDELDLAVTTGRITAADRGNWEGRLKVDTNFANELTALRALRPTVKTDSVTIDRGSRKIEVANAAERRELVAELVNEEMEGSKCDYDKAYAKVQRKFPQLFEAMAQPEIGGKRKK